MKKDAQTDTPLRFYSDIRENGILTISEGTIAKKAVYITVGNNSTVTIGEDCLFHGEVTLYTKDNCNLTIGDGCIIIDTKIVCGSNASVSIGANTTINDNSAIFCRTDHVITIGNDCMFSQDVVVHAGDAHPIIDTSTQQITNDPPSDSPKKRILIHDHVWLGWGCMVLHGSEVGAGSIIAARSLVNKRFPNNCLIAGHPATLKKSNTGWKRSRNWETPDTYLELTREI